MRLSYAVPIVWRNSNIMKKTSAIVIGLFAILLAAGFAFAGEFSVLGRMDDIEAEGFEPGTTEIQTAQYIQNGDFMDWSGGLPVGWTVVEPALSPGWNVHVAEADLALSELSELRGNNNALAAFFQAGTDGAQYLDVYQQVSPELQTGDYWVQLHMTAWGENVTSSYNSVAWYGFSDTPSASGVSEWRELIPHEFICKNYNHSCAYTGRREIMEVEAGSYLVVRMGMKFADHGSWTQFVLDDISITPDDSAEDLNEIDEFVTDGDVSWDYRSAR